MAFDAKTSKLKQFTEKFKWRNRKPTTRKARNRSYKCKQ